MTKEEIDDLINSNEVIAAAYKEFKKKCNYRKIIDMWQDLHINYPVDEVYIKYENYYGEIKKFEYYKEI